MKILLPACLLILAMGLAQFSNARSEHASAFYARALASIPAPEITAFRATIKEQHLPAIARFNNLTDHRKRGWYWQSGSGDHKKAGLGLMIAGSVCLAGGVAFIIAGSQMHSYTSNGVYHPVYPEGYYIVGLLLGAGGLGMLIPGICLTARHGRN